MDYKPYVDLFAALLTPTIAIITTYIAIQQYRIGKAQLHLQQFDRRVAVFRGVAAFLGSVERYGQVRGEDLSALIGATAEKRFLFERDLCNYLDEIRRNSVTMWALQVELEQVPVGPKRSDLVERQMKILVWIHEQPPTLEEHFTKYLRVNS